MAKVNVRLLVVLMIVPIAALASGQQTPAQQTATWALTFDPSGRDTGAVRRVGYPMANLPSALSHRGKDGKVFEALAQTAKVKQTAENAVIELSDGWYSMTMQTNQRMSAPAQFNVLSLTLNKAGEIVTLKFSDY